MLFIILPQKRFHKGLCNLYILVCCDDTTKVKILHLNISLYSFPGKKGCQDFQEWKNKKEYQNGGKYYISCVEEAHNSKFLIGSFLSTPNLHPEGLGPGKN